MKRRRVNSNLPDNLYTSKKGGKYYFQYRNPQTGKYTGMGTDRSKAIDAANKLNQKLCKPSDTDSLVARVLGTGKTMDSWLDEYLPLFMEHVEHNKLSKDTVDNRKSMVRRIRAHFGNQLLADIDVEAVASLLDSIAKDEGKARTAQQVRTSLVDIFNVAREQGLVNDNPASVTRNPRRKVARARLTLDEFNTILEQTKGWHSNAMLLALLTGQRRSDIATMQFKEVSDNWLHIKQSKTGSCVRLSLDLGLNAVGLTIGDVISTCRDSVVSPWLLHQNRYSGKSKPGDPINRTSISRAFMLARNKTDLKWDSPPSYHEIRSLSGRLYNASIDAQALLGHRDPKTTALYLDSKGTEWVSVGKN